MVNRPYQHAAMAALLLSNFGLAYAGPPLTIDDPGILDPGKFEVILAGAIEARRSGDSYHLPILDVSYGVSQNIQIAGVAIRDIVNPDGGSTKSDLGLGAVGIKWRFLNHEKLQMSVAPYYTTNLRDGAVNRGVVDDTDAWTLPVEFQYEFSGWRLNAEVGYSWLQEASDEWAYGIAAAYPLSKRIEAMVEIHGGADHEFDDDGHSYRVGADITLKENLHLLVALGSSFHESGDDDLDLQGYLGLQWFP